MQLLVVSIFFALNVLMSVLEFFSSSKRFKNILFLVFIVTYSFLFSFRDGLLDSVDYHNYVIMFNSFPGNFSDAVIRVEPFFGGVIYLMRELGFSAESFLSMVSFIFHFSIAYFLYKFSRWPIFLFLLISVTSFYFNFAGNIVRQGLAVSFVLTGLVCTKNRNSGFYYFIAFLTHYTSLFLVLCLFLYRYFPVMKNKFLLIFFLFFSLAFFVIDFSFLWGYLGKIAYYLNLPYKVVANFEVDESLVTGRIYYLISFVVVFFAILFKSRVDFYLSDNALSSLVIYNKLLFIVYACTVIYPVLIQFSYFSRVAGYGFFIAPLILGVLLKSLMSSRAALFLGAIFYIFMSVSLFLKSDYLIM